MDPQAILKALYEIQGRADPSSDGHYGNMDRAQLAGLLLEIFEKASAVMEATGFEPD
jgi:hypothetical protein